MLVSVENKMRTPPELLQAVLAREGKHEGNEIRFLCPAHDDEHPSARFNPKMQVWYCDSCKEGGGLNNLCQRLGVPLSASANLEETFDYVSAAGELLFQVVRKAGKEFRQRRPDGHGGWIWNLKGVKRVLYRLLEVIKAVEQEKTIYVAEGEKDVDNIARLGLVATTNPGGAGKWHATYSESLRNARVTILPDNDSAGRTHAEKVASSLLSIATEVRILELPDLPEKGDVSDWISAQEKAGKSADEIRAALEQLAAETPCWEVVVASICSDSNRKPEEIIADLEALDEEPDLAELQRLVQEFGAALGSTDQLSIAVNREGAIKALQGKVKAPARIVDAALIELPGKDREETTQGRAVAFREPEPWPEPVDGSVLLDSLSSAFERYVILQRGRADALALWVVHTFALAAAWITPRLAITSPVKRCAKTTLLIILEHLVARPLMTSNVSAAALFRCIEKFRPSLLVDEADTFLTGKDELRGILNSGHRQGGTVMRSAGDDHDPRVFATFAPVAIALIGKLPSDTLADRSIEIKMRRKKREETVESLRLDRLGHLEELRRCCARWTQDHFEELRQADPEVTSELHDRAADNWRPLLAIADAVGGDWPVKARSAAVTLSGIETVEDGSAGPMLLADIREMFRARNVDILASKTLLTDLLDLEERPWGEWRRGQPLTAIGLARLLNPFGIKPRQVRVGPEKTRGYRLCWFEDVFARYLPSDPVHPVQTAPEAGSRHSGSRYNEDAVPTTQAGANADEKPLVPGVPTANPEHQARSLPQAALAGASGQVRRETSRGESREVLEL